MKPAIVVSTPLPNALLPLKRPVNDARNNPKSKRPLSVSFKPAKIPTSDDQPLALCYGNHSGMDHGSDETMTASKSKEKPKSKSGNQQQQGGSCIDDEQDERGKEGAGNKI